MKPLFPVLFTDKKGNSFFYVQVRAQAKENAFVGKGQNAQGFATLRIKVTSTPEKGKANQAVLKLLAKGWKIPLSSFEILTGHTQSEKKISLSSYAVEKLSVK